MMERAKEATYKLGLVYNDFMLSNAVQYKSILNYVFNKANSNNVGITVDVVDVDCRDREEIDPEDGIVINGGSMLIDLNSEEDMGLDGLLDVISDVAKCMVKHKEHFILSVDIGKLRDGTYKIIEFQQQTNMISTSFTGEGWFAIARGVVDLINLHDDDFKIKSSDLKSSWIHDAKEAKGKLMYRPYHDRNKDKA